jgi:hypothetical protein
MKQKRSYAREEVSATGTRAATSLKSGGWPRLFLPDIALRISNEGDCAIWTWFSLQEERPLGRLQHLVSSPRKRISSYAPSHQRESGLTDTVRIEA